MATILTKRSNTASSVPVAGDLTNSTGGAELAVNTADKRLFTKDSGGTVVELGTNPSSVTLPNGTANGVPYLNGSKVLTSGSALTFNGTTFRTLSGAVASGGSANGKFRLDRSDGATNLGYIDWITAGDGLRFYNNNGGYFSWEQSSAGEMMRLTSTGLGIGTSSPGTKLDVQGTGNTTLRVQTNTSGNPILAFSAAGDDGASIYYGRGTGLLNIDISSVVGAVRLNTAGNLGLGVTPSAWSAGKAYELVSAGNAMWALSNENNITQNAVYNAGWKYGSTGASTRYQQQTGSHIWFTAPSGTAGNAISFTQAMTLNASGGLALGVTTDPGAGNIQLGSGAYVGTGIGTGNTTGSYYGTNEVRFYTSATERARIDSSGGLLVGTTSNPNNRKFITSSSATVYAPNRMESTASSGQLGGLYVIFTAQSPNDASSQFFGCDDSTASRFTVRSNGGIANYQANNVNLSDRREKTNFAPSKSYLETICAIPVQTFNYIDQNLENDDGLTLGVVAQDVQAVAPELVMESNWGTEDNPKMRLSIYQTDLQYALMKALQELKAEFDAYKASHP